MSKNELQDKTVYVIDAHNLLYQVFHAISEMSSPLGEPVNALFGFVRDILTIKKQFSPDYLLCAYDSPGQNFRHTIYENYKSNRTEMPLDLRPQIAFSKEILSAFDIPFLQQSGFEADDILATIARLCTENGAKCVLVTADKDARQLISDSVSIYLIRKDERYGKEQLGRDWGIAPENVVDFQALVGDTSDNVPGIFGIGPKFATQLIQKYATVEKILENVAEVSGEKRKLALKNGRDIALMSRELVTLKSNVPIDIDWNSAKSSEINDSKLRPIFLRFGFKKFAADLPKNLPKELPKNADEDDFSDMPLFQHANKSEKNIIVHSAELPKYNLLTPENFAEFLYKLSLQDIFALDLETVSIDSKRFEATQPRYCNIAGMSFCWAENEAFYLPFRAPETGALLDENDTLKKLKPILEDPNILKIGQNLKFDIVVLRSAGIKLQGLHFDTLIADYLLNAGERHRINDIAERFLNFTMLSITDLIGTGKSQIGMNEVPLDKMTRYACDDVWVPFRLYPLLKELLKADALLWNLFNDCEIPLVGVLAELEYNGIAINTDILAELSTRLGTRLIQLEKEIFDIAGHAFNIASPKQLQDVLFHELKLPILKKTATGASTDVDVLEKLAKMHKLPCKILEYRQTAKLKGTYVDVFPVLLHPETKRIHASFNQSVTATGRLSSSNPNLQNIPIRTEEGRELRTAFIPGEGYDTIMGFDYSQIELRVLAHCSGDAALCRAFDADEDIHSRVASDIFAVPLADVTTEMRQQAKAVNFGLIYGQSSFGLAEQLGITQSDAARFIVAFYKQFPQIMEYFDVILADAHKNNFVRTIFGRKRAIFGVRNVRNVAKDGTLNLNLSERTAINTVIQGAAADLMKQAMCAVSRNLSQSKIKANMLLQIHDELVFEVAAKDADTLRNLVVDAMSLGQPLRVPLKIDVSSGQNWGEMDD